MNCCIRKAKSQHQLTWTEHGVLIWIWSNVDNKSLAPMDWHLLQAILSSQVKSVHLIQTNDCLSRQGYNIYPLCLLSHILYAEKFTKFSLLLLNPSKEKQAWLRHKILSIVISPLPLQILRSPDLFTNQSINHTGTCKEFTLLQASRLARQQSSTVAAFLRSKWAESKLEIDSGKCKLDPLPPSRITSLLFD